MKYFSICSIVKDETHYLEEWICMNLAIGVEHFYIYDNASKVPVKHTLKKYIDSGRVTVILIHGTGKQLEVYNDCLVKFRRQSKFIAFIDCDEFFCLKNQTDLKLVLERYEKYAGLAINWMLFGSSGYVNRTDDWIVETRLHRAKEQCEINRHVKTILNTDFRCKWIYNPHLVTAKDSFIVNENHQKIETSFDDYSYNQVRLNHYFTKSKEEFKQKVLRGKADKPKMQDKRDMKEFEWHDELCSIYDDEIVKFVPVAKKYIL